MYPISAVKCYSSPEQIKIVYVVQIVRSAETVKPCVQARDPAKNFIPAAEAWDRTRNKKGQPAGLEYINKF